MRFPLNVLLLALHVTSAVVASDPTRTTKLNMTELELLDRSFNDTMLHFANLTQTLAEELNKTIEALTTSLMLVTLAVLLDEEKKFNMSSTSGGKRSTLKRNLKGGSKANKRSSIKRHTRAQG